MGPKISVNFGSETTGPIVILVLLLDSLEQKKVKIVDANRKTRGEVKNQTHTHYSFMPLGRKLKEIIILGVLEFSLIILTCYPTEQ